QQELTVSELCAVLQLPQSTVSRHLKLLGDAGWVSVRRDGTSRYYTLALDGAGGADSEIWKLTKPQLVARTDAEQDGRRLTRVIGRRSESSARFFATSAGEWDRLRAELFGREFVHGALVGVWLWGGEWGAGALVGLLPRHWVVADLGCGTGAMLPVLAPHVARVIGVDASDEMLAAARDRARAFDNVELRTGALAALPIEAASVDAATLMLVLHHLASPIEALKEAARVLKPDGRLLIVDMTPHDHEEYAQRMGHVWLGFADEARRR